MANLPVQGPIFVLGAGGHAKVVVATAQAAGIRVAACFDDDPTRWGTKLLGVPIAGSLSSAAGRGGALFAALGDNRLRLDLVGSFNASERWATIVHPSALVHPSAVLGQGTIVMAGAILQPDAVLGAHVVVNTGASVDHDAVVGSGAHVAPGARLAGGVDVGEGVLFGMGAVAIPGVRIGAWATVGAGAAVVAHVPERTVVVGIPARPLDLRGRT